MKDINWPLPTNEAFYLNKTVHIWKIKYSDFNTDKDVPATVLDTTEKERANRFHFDIDRKRYLLTRVSLKTILAKIIQSKSQKLELSFSEHGKPYLKNHNEIHFNVSHSENIGLIAVSDLAPIGVDVEHFRKRMNLIEIAKRFFSENEVADLLSLENYQKESGFFNCWTRKEAFIKAVGLGLSMPLKNFDVTLKPGIPAQLLELREGKDNADEWSLKDIPVENEYAAAFALKALNFKESYWSVRNLF